MVFSLKRNKPTKWDFAHMRTAMNYANLSHAKRLKVGCVIVKNNEVWTSTGDYCMNGITRSKVIEACSKNNMICHQKNFSLYDTYSAQESFVTGTFGGLTPVTHIDGKQIGDGKLGQITSNLSGFYEMLISENIDE